MNTIDSKPESKTETKSNCCKIVNMAVKRSDDGLKITLQSPIDFKILKRPQKFSLGNVTCFTPRQEQVEGIDSLFSTSQSHEVNGMPNLTMLLAENLKAGVTFVFPPMPISDERIKQWIEQFRQDAKILYLTYVKPVDYSVVITSQTIESEIHY